MKIGLFFGSFNPIHLGHTEIARTILKWGLVDKIIFMVSPQSPAKEDKDLAPFQDRLKMVALALKEEKKMEVSDIEKNLPLPNFTINTLNEIKKTYNRNNTYYIIMGEDNYWSFDSWRDYKKILEEYQLIVYPRVFKKKWSNKAKPDWENIENESRIHFLKLAKLRKISSSEIRAFELIKNPSTPLLHKEVALYIKEKEIYKYRLNGHSNKF